MILVTGHHIKRNPGLRQMYHIQQIFNQTLEDKNILCQADIIDALGCIRAKSRAHAARQKHCPHFAGFDGFQTDFGVLFFFLLDLRKFHHTNGFDLPSRVQSFLLFTESEHRKIRLLDLGKQRPLLLFAQLLVVFQHMKLSVFFQFFICLLIVHRTLLNHIFQNLTAIYLSIILA